MMPTPQQVTRHFRRLNGNYEDLIKLLGEAKTDLNTIFGATDKPIPAAESFAGLILEAALGVALPEGKAFYSFVNNMIEGAKKMKEKVEEMNRYQQIVDQALQRATRSAAAEVSDAYHNGAMGMISTINSISDRLYAQKALNTKLWELFESLQGKKAAEPFFQSIDWNNPPAFVGDNSKDIRYIFTYILVRLAVFRFVRLKMHRQSNPFELGLTELLVTNIEPEGISRAGCDYIFANFNRSFGDPRNVNMAMSARNIVSIRNYYDMIDNWYPDLDISVGTHEELVKVMDPGNRRHHFTTKMWMIANGFKRALPEVVTIPEFRMN